MTKYRLQTQHVPRYTVAQGEALEAIGKAFKRGLIDFEAATELRDLVREGRTDEAMAALAERAPTSVPSQRPHCRRASGKVGDR